MQEYLQNRHGVHGRISFILNAPFKLEILMIKQNKNKYGFYGKNTCKATLEKHTCSQACNKDHSLQYVVCCFSVIL